MAVLDAKKNNPLKGGPSFPLRHRIFRALWIITWALLAAWTPAPLHAWRRLVLAMFGAKLHKTARVYGSVKVWYPPNLSMAAHSVMGPGVECYCMANISIGEKVVISQQAYLCGGTHDISSPHFQLVAKEISIQKNSWVAARAFVGPGVTIAEGSVIGGGCVVFQDTEAFGVYIGNPARLIKHRTLSAQDSLSAQ